MTEELTAQGIKNGLLQLDESLRALFSALNGSVESLLPEIKDGNSVQKESKEKLLDVVKKLTDDEKERFDDIKADIIRTADTIEEEYTSLVTRTENSIRSDVGRDYVAQSEYGTYKNTTATYISQLTDSIALGASDIEAVDTALQSYKRENDSAISLLPASIESTVSEKFTSKTELGEAEERILSKTTQTSKNITDDFKKEYNGKIDGVNGDVKELRDSIDAYIRRGELEDGIYGIEIGQSNSNIIARFVSDRLSFRQGGTEVAYISDANLYITRAEVLDCLRIGTSTEGYFTFDVTLNGLEVRWSE